MNIINKLTFLELPPIFCIIFFFTWNIQSIISLCKTHLRWCVFTWKRGPFIYLFIFKWEKITCSRQTCREEKSSRKKLHIEPLALCFGSKSSSEWSCRRRVLAGWYGEPGGPMLEGPFFNQSHWCIEWAGSQITEVGFFALPAGPF